MTARSLGDKTHEWTEFQAGIFSHEVRSGLLGAADADRNGKVTYRELGAFVRRANEAIVNRKYRPEVVTQPPAGDPDAVFAELPDGPMVLELDNDPGRIFVDSENGVRLADLHPAPGMRLALRLPTDLGVMYVQQVGSEREVRLEPKPGRLLLSALAPSTARARARGAAHDAFRLLFARQFDAPRCGASSRRWPTCSTWRRPARDPVAAALDRHDHRRGGQRGRVGPGPVGLQARGQLQRGLGPGSASATKARSAAPIRPR